MPKPCNCSEQRDGKGVEAHRDLLHPAGRFRPRTSNPVASGMDTLAQPMLRSQSVDPMAESADHLDCRARLSGPVPDAPRIVGALSGAVICTVGRRRMTPEQAWERRPRGLAVGRARCDLRVLGHMGRAHRETPGSVTGSRRAGVSEAQHQLIAGRVTVATRSRRPSLPCHESLSLRR
jgi:hypothetical protein